MAVSIEDKVRETIASYDSTVNAYFKNTLPLHRAEPARKFYSMLPAGRVCQAILDHGCGPGRDAKVFSDQYGLRVYGLDMSREMIRFAREYAPRASFTVADMRGLPFRDESLDGIWSVASMLNTPKADANRVLGEACRVLRPGGVLYIRMKQGEGETFDFDKRYDPPVRKLVSFYSEDEFNALLARNGFAVEDSECRKPGEKYQPTTELNVFAVRN